MNFDNISVVLVEPQGPLNIGSVCRAMMNFGFSDLRLVNPSADHLSDEARRMAVKASALLEGARIFPDLAAALADCQLALGTTRRFGKYREDFLHPDQAARVAHPLAEKGRVALVFGREDNGLLTAELDLCQRFITIPTSEALPSMNLAQAVSLCLYEVAKCWGELAGKGGGRKRLASGKVLEGLYRHMRQTLLDIEYLDPQNPEHILHTYRRIFGRAGLNEREVRILHGLWSRIDWLESERKKRR
ncbi:tRNA (cytidine/uridine-2'-O-)-methyltransferase TrmJ [Desulfuromonas versatilis]|uniref:tRNA (cytidine/uridine-2'-O-)-methyltransferase TrmJ n=1 Tax=Desulfuromonas versatilis TaxID=2802975 RepID=A0ABM8HUS2_9BACT|nr:RNA methyltransferase [Desulfuromonas versatilis]BCR04820.1 tRNA (cytidine/uridine-2'-O-)-methyltransferase TrmJ [Desulfuromonas versatilis]